MFTYDLQVDVFKKNLKNWLYGCTKCQTTLYSWAIWDVFSLALYFHSVLKFARNFSFFGLRFLLLLQEFMGWK